MTRWALSDRGTGVRAGGADRRLAWCFAGLCALVPLWAAPAARSGAVAGETSFRCGTRLVALGASRASVKSACGEPTTARLVQTDALGPKGTRIHVERELWTYDHGSLEFSFSLTFAGDRLETIERGDYGG